MDSDAAEPLQAAELYAEAITCLNHADYAQAISIAADKVLSLLALLVQKYQY
jgi:hypothetical protein